MVVVQWGMAEFIRDQSILNLIKEDQSAARDYKNLRNSEQRTAFWKRIIDAKQHGPDRAKSLEFIARFETLKNNRDDIIHRLWGGGMEPGTLGAPSDFPTTDASLHRHRDEKVKTKSQDARANLRWRLSFAGLRDIAQKMAQLNQDIMASWLPPGSPPGMYHVWSYPNDQGQLEVGIGITPDADDKSHTKD